jgi:hypothetical protein
MSIELTDAIREAVAAAGTPLKLVDSHTGQSYVLVSESAFQRVETLLRDDLADTYPAQMESAMRAGWDDPAMDQYNDYDRHRASSARLQQIAPRHRPPQEWLEENEEELF